MTHRIRGPGSSGERRDKRLLESLKVLIANPGHRISVDDRLERYFFLAGGRAPWSIIKHKKKMPRYSAFPFFLAYTAALLERDGFEVQAVDAVPLNLTSEETERRCVETRPDLLLLEPSTVAIDGALAFCARIKDRTGALCVLAGPHVTWHGSDLLAKHDAVDFVMVGEYEMAFAALASRLRNRERFDDLPGFYYRDGAGNVTGGQRAPEQIPNSPPGPRRQSPARYITHVHTTTYTHAPLSPPPRPKW